METLYGTATGASNIIAMSVNESHSASNTIATIECGSFSGTIGNEIEIDMGFVSSHGKVFTGYVKSIEQTVPENIYSITCSDKLIRASDFFIVPDSPTSSFTRSNIAAEQLVEDVLGLSGITGVDSQATSFTLAVNGTEAEVKLVSSYDYSKSIADLLAWHLWADRGGTINFKNRKPYVMLGTSGQPGDIADVPLSGKEINDSNAINIVYRVSEVDLRNKVVVWGYNGITASSSATSPYLPDGYFKTVLFSNDLVDTQDMADRVALYNREALNRPNREVTASVIGDYILQTRKTINVSLSNSVGVEEQMYIFSATHSWSSAGYEVSLVLRG